MAAPGNRSEESGPQFRLITANPRTRELTGAVDLLSHYGLRDQYETMCRKPLPVSIGESHYLKNVVGETDIRKGEGMELGQLLEGPDTEISNVHIQNFDLDVLRQAFSLREFGPISLPEADRGTPTISGKTKEELKDKDKKHKKHKKHKDRHKDRDKDKDKDRHKDRDKEKEKEKDKEKEKEKEKKDKDKDKEKEKDRNKKRENGEDGSKKHHKKKRKHDGDEEDGEAHKHKKKKHKHSSKAEAPELTKNRG